MDFPIDELLDEELSEAWLLKYFHPEGLSCPHCEASVEEARAFRTTQKSQVRVYRCKRCQGVYTVYSGTVFAAKHFRPAQAILLLRGVCKGQPAAEMARELGVSRQTVHEMRKRLQGNAEARQARSPLGDARTETDEMFQNAGEKR